MLTNCVIVACRYRCVCNSRMQAVRAFNTNPFCSDCATLHIAQHRAHEFRAASGCRRLRVRNRSWISCNACELQKRQQLCRIITACTRDDLIISIWQLEHARISKYQPNRTRHRTHLRPDRPTLVSQTQYLRFYVVGSLDSLLRLARGPGEFHHLYHGVSVRLLHRSSQYSSW